MKKLTTTLGVLGVAVATLLAPTVASAVPNKAPAPECRALPAGVTIDGTAAADSLLGTAATDVMAGRQESDTLTADAGDDLLHGGSGADTLNGDAGDDTLCGNPGSDTGTGGAGIDAATDVENIDLTIENVGIRTGTAVVIAAGASPTCTSPLPLIVTVSCPAAGTIVTATCQRVRGAATITVNGTIKIRITCYTLGVACSPTGKINGRGATFAKNAQIALSDGYRDDVCGRVSNGVAPLSPLLPLEPDNMSFYNYANAEGFAPPLTGSGNGRTAYICRSDAFGMTDGPYSTAQLGATATQGTLRGPKGVASNCTSVNGATPLTPPFQPSPGPGYPALADSSTTAPMSFPIAGASVTVSINLQPTASCLAPPSAINLTATQVSKLFGGRNNALGGTDSSIVNWNDPQLRTSPAPNDNPDLASCDKPVTRVVREDNSGTTQIFKNYLAKAQGGDVLCDPTNPAAGTPNTWTALALGANNQVWPGVDIVSGKATPRVPQPALCAPVKVGAGNPGMVTVVGANDGAIGYIDLSDALASPVTFKLANLQNSTLDAFVGPATGAASNCSFAGATLPTGGANGAVGLVGSAWTSDGAGSKSNVTFTGTGYPVCGLTFVLIPTGLSLSGDMSPDPELDVPVATAISRLSADQRQTMYSYFSYVLSPLGQAKLASAAYAAIPGGTSNGSYAATIRQGYQANL